MKQGDPRDAFFYFQNVSTRWGDNDIYGHVNNVAYYSYFDTVVNRYLIEHAGVDIHADQIVGFVVSSSCDYFAPVAYPDTVRVGFRVNKIGRSSVEYGVAAFLADDERARAVGRFTHVFVDRATATAIDIPDRIRQALEKALVHKSSKEESHE